MPSTSVAMDESQSRGTVEVWKHFSESNACSKAYNRRIETRELERTVLFRGLDVTLHALAYAFVFGVRVLEKQ